MSDNQTFGFGKFVPGFEFLQNIAKGSSQALPQMPGLSNWVAPTLNVEDLQKRIDELKAVHFWLDQNSRALSATVQALELQKMTLATLKGMNFNMADIANALKLKTDGAAGPAAEGTQAYGAASAEPPAEVPSRARKSGKAAGRGGDPEPGAAPDAAAARSAGGLVDPLQWWSALTQQFQEIAAGAVKDSGGQAAVEAARNLTAGATQAAMKMAGGMAEGGAAPAGKTRARKAPAKAPRKGTRAAQ